VRARTHAFSNTLTHSHSRHTHALAYSHTHTLTNCTLTLEGRQNMGGVMRDEGEWVWTMALELDSLIDTAVGGIGRVCR
jgi:hypothetical protein